jgi:hypothetical protein
MIDFTWKFGNLQGYKPFWDVTVRYGYNLLTYFWKVETLKGLEYGRR